MFERDRYVGLSELTVDITYSNVDERTKGKRILWREI
jgi:hypothetical protein